MLIKKSIQMGKNVEELETLLKEKIINLKVGYLKNFYLSFYKVWNSRWNQKNRWQVWVSHKIAEK